MKKEKHEIMPSQQVIKDKIYTIRNTQVMLDKDLAELYGVKPIRLREQVRRNKERFPNDFMFILSESEVDFMVSQFAIPSLLSKNTHAKITLYTKSISQSLRLDIGKFNAQFGEKITLKEFLLSHDRFLIIDDEIYHFGASLKDLGKKWFAFSKMDNEFLQILERLEKGAK